MAGDRRGTVREGTEKGCMLYDRREEECSEPLLNKRPEQDARSLPFVRKTGTEVRAGDGKGEERGRVRGRRRPACMHARATHAARDTSHEHGRHLAWDPGLGMGPEGVHVAPTALRGCCTATRGLRWPARMPPRCPRTCDRFDRSSFLSFPRRSIINSIEQEYYILECFTAASCSMRGKLTRNLYVRTYVCDTAGHHNTV
jgi:hypothetical protein